MRTFTETHDEIPPRPTHTRHFDNCLSARAIETPYAQVAEEDGVSFYRVDKASRARAGRLEASRTLDPPTRLNVDEQSHLRGRTALPHAAIVCDRFHIERMVLDAVDALRRAIQNEVPKGAKAPLFRARRKLRKGTKRLTLKDLDDLAALFDDHPDLEVAWALAWDMKHIYAALDRAEATSRLGPFYEDAEESGLIEFAELVRTLRAWETELLNHFDTRLTNGYAEGVTNKIKVIKRRAYGCPNFDSFRRRVLLACG